MAAGRRARARKPTDGANARLFLIHFEPGKKLFQLLVGLSDSPGSYRSVLDLISSRVNLIGTQTYSLSDGTAVFNGLCEALSKRDTKEGLKKLILTSKSVAWAEVAEGVDGLLVDTFNKGIEVNGEPYMLIRRKGQAAMMDGVARTLGTGGEALLYNEGCSLGMDSSRSLGEKLGAKRATEQRRYLANLMAARGWGETELEDGKGDVYSIWRMKGCFECSSGPSPRKGCNFMRGYFAGVDSVVSGREVDCTETRCVLKGGEWCEFVSTLRGSSGSDTLK